MILKRLPRLLLILGLLTLPSTALWAQTATVTATPGTCANVTGIGSDNWNNPGNALTQNGTSATVSMNDGEISRYLRCTDYGFTIPTGVTISGITVTVRRSVDNAGGNPRDYAVQLLKAGVLQATNYADTGTTYPTALAFANYGGTGNLWGTTWTVADINNANFGVSFVSNKPGTTGGNRTVSVDVISVAVTYTDTTAPTVTSITRVDATPTNGISSASWTVTFSEPVTGVNAADFVLVQGGGMSGASIASVTGSGTTWTVTANLGVNTGTLGLNLVDDDSVQDSVGNRLGGTGTGNGNFTGEVYTVTAAPCNPPSNIPVGVTVACVCDNFNRTNLNPSPIFGQDWITSISDSTGIQPSIVNSNYLRLTNNTGNNAKAATVPSAFPAAGNYISVEFLHYAYNGSGADGIAVTLSDYNVPAVPGAYGGSLGYAQQTAINGFAGGWLGVALDEYGNYQNPTEGRLGGPGFLVDSVGVRGSGSGTTGYRWLQGTAANLAPGIDNAGSTARAPGYRYQIVVDARNAGATTPQTLVTVNRDTTGGGYAALIPQFDAFARAVTLGFTQAPVPANWQISFTGSTGGSTNIHEIGSLRICAQTVVPPSGGVASGFAVIDEAYGTPPIAVQNYLTGRIYTKVAGTPFKLNVAAINNNQVQTGYVLTGSRNVDVKLVDNNDGVCVLNSTQANYCSAACRGKAAVTGGTQTLNFVPANAGQRQSADFTVPGAWNNLVAIVNDGTTSACSTDAFSVRPPRFDTISSTASNASAAGLPAFRAGTDAFSMTVGTNTTGYAGAAALPTINPAGVAANAAGWAVGSIAPSNFPAAVASSSSGNTFTYSEVGQFRFLGYDPAVNTSSPRGLHDSTWTAVDQSTMDCIAGSYANTRDTSGTFASNSNYGKYGCLFGLGANSALFGRFIPDRFTLTAGSVTPSCTGTTRNFTYMGQARLGVAYRLEARNGANGITQNYDATRAAVIAPTLVAEDQDAANQSCNLAGRLTGLPTATWTAGVYNAATTPTAQAVFSRPASAAPGALNASSPALCAATLANAGNPFWNLDLGVLVNDGSASMTGANMHAGTTGVCSGAGCNAIRLGSTGMVLGRLNLLNAYGSDALPLLVPVRAEYWNGSSWQLNTEDRCTTLSANNLAVGNTVSNNGLSVTNTSLALSPAATLSGGVTNFRITPTARGAGSVDVVLNLGLGVDANVDWCGAWTSGPASGTGTAPVPDLSFMAAQWCGANADRAPAARLRFGSPNTPFIYLRERY
jgi:MSHA biogenesis protein MshQ